MKLFSDRKMLSLLFLVVLGLVFSFGQTVEASYNPAAIGQGGTGAVNTGIPALFDNPAAVHVDNPGVFSLDLGFAGGVGNNYFDYDIIVEMLEDEDYEDIIDDLGDDGLRVYGDFAGGARARFGPAGAFQGSISPFAAVRGDAAGNVGAGVFRFASDFDDIDFEDLEDEEVFEEVEDLALDLGDTEAAFGTYADLGVGLSYDVTDTLGSELAADFSQEEGEVNIDKLTLGANLHYLQGAAGEVTGTGRLDFERVEFSTEDIDGIDEDVTEELVMPLGELQAEASHSQDEVAGGIGLDIGAYGEFNDRYAAGFSVQNLLGSVSTDAGQVIDADLNLEEDELRDKIYERAEEKYDDGSPPEEAIQQAFVEVLEEELDETYDESEGTASYRLPLVLRAAGSMEAIEDVTVSGGLTFKNSSLGPNDLRLAAGVETAQLSPLKVRGGANYSSQRQGLILTTGLGLDLGALRADFSLAGLRALTGSSQNLEGGFNLGLEF